MVSKTGTTFYSSKTEKQTRKVQLKRWGRALSFVPGKGEKNEIILGENERGE